MKAVADVEAEVELGLDEIVLGARLELSRTYFQVGKRLLEPGSKYKKLNGIKGEEYLNKARALFDKMNLQWDLDELDRSANF